MIDEAMLLIDLEIEQRSRTKERLKENESQIDYYKNNPLDYLVERLGFRRDTLDWASLKEYGDHKWDGTYNPLVRVLQSLADCKWTGVESATGVGKTKLGAGIVLWFLECFKDSLVVVTAPKNDQLKLHIWREIGKMKDQFGRGELGSLRLRMIQGSDNWQAVGFVAGVKAGEDVATKAQGFHAEHLLIVMEETPGIRREIMDAFQNTAGGGHNLILAFGNPDNQMDVLHKFCEMPNVEHIIISGYDHPNIVTKNSNFIAGAQTNEGLIRLLHRYGSKEHPLYKSRARGISPAQSLNAAIKYEWCIESIYRYEQYETYNDRIDEAKIKGYYSLGVDVANSESGDKAAIAEGKGNVLLSVIDFACPNSNQLGTRDVRQRMKDKKISADRVGVDGIGVGAGTVNALHDIGLRVVSIMSGNKADWTNDNEQFNNLRSQMWWQMREDLRNGLIDIPNDDELIADLVSPQWEVKNGKIVFESKQDIKNRLGRSPNKGDAAVYWNWVRTGKRSVPEIDATIY